MLCCQHFIYTTASLKDKSGYQIVAQSKNISSELLSKLKGNFLPVGVDPANIEKCYVFFVFENDVVFSTIKNIGIGFDGRNNTLYNHSIILSKDDFLKIHNNPKVLSEYFIDDYSIQGNMEPVIINEQDIKNYDLSFFADWPKTILEYVFDGIFNNKKIALYGISDNKFLLNLISVLPESLRLQSFSTGISDPNKQSTFNILQINSDMIFNKDNSYETIHISKLRPIYTHDIDTVFERSVKFFTDLIKNQHSKSLESVNTFFDEINDVSNVDKLKLTTHFERVKFISDESTKQRLSIEIFNMLDNFDIDTIGKILPTIKDFVPVDVYNKYSLQLEILHLVKSTMNTGIDFAYVSSLFHRLSRDNSENRSLLLDQIIKTRFDEIKSVGDKLLLDSRYALYYGNDIIKKFLETTSLHSCIFKLFVPRKDFSKSNQQSFFELIIQISLDVNVFVTLKLLQTSIFDFNNQFESKHYREILSSVFDHSVLSDIVYIEESLNLSTFLYEKISNITNYIPSSGTSGTTRSNLEQFIQIIHIFHKYFENQKKSISKNIHLHERISKHSESLSHYLDQNQVEPEPKPWWQWY